MALSISQRYAAWDEEGDKLRQMAAEMAMKVAAVRKVHFPCTNGYDIEELDIHHDRIYVRVEEYTCGCCGPESYTIEVPFTYFDDPNWEEKERARIELAEAETLAKEAERARKAAEEEERKEREQLAKLQEKYKDTV